MKKAIGMFAALILALGMTGVGYATWQESLVISGTVNTGTVDVEWSDVRSWDTEPPEKDVSSITCVIDGNTLTVTVTNAYPSIDYYNVVDIHSVGSIPVHLHEVFVSPPDPNVLVEISYYEDIDLTIPAILPVQLHECEEIFVEIHVHIEQDALEGHTYTFTAEIVAVQWNLKPEVVPEVV